MSNKTTLVFETSADIKDFIKRRKLSHGKINLQDVTLTALLNEGDIAFAVKEYKAEIVAKK